MPGWETLCLNQKNGGHAVDGSSGQLISACVDTAAVAPMRCARVTVHAQVVGALRRGGTRSLVGLRTSAAPTPHGRDRPSLPWSGGN